MNLRRLLWPGLPLFAVIVLRWLLTPDPALPAYMERMINVGLLQRASAAGWPARLVKAEGDRAALEAAGRRLQASQGQDVTYLLVSEDDVAFVPSPSFQTLFPSAREDRIYRWAEAPLAFRRPNTAVQALAVAFASVLAEAGKISRTPPLPPLYQVRPASALEEPGDSVDWGLPLALLIPLALAFARRRLQARTHARSIAGPASPAFQSAAPADRAQ